MTFEYITHILVLKDYASPNKEKLEVGKVYRVGLRKHPLFGSCYYLMEDEETEHITGYYIEKDTTLFKEINNSTTFILT